MRVATYNVLHGRPIMNPRDHANADDPNHRDAANPMHLAEAIANLDADIVAVQELDRFQLRSGEIDQVTVVADAQAAEHWRFVPTVMGTPGGREGFRSATTAEMEQSIKAGAQSRPQYGIALFSRLPVLTWRTTSLPPAPVSLPLLVQTDGKPRITRVRDEQRAAIAAIVETGAGPITVVATHLSFVPGFNVYQLRRIIRWTANMPGPLLLIGDFNLPHPIPARVSGFRAIINERTFPSYQPRVQFDHILARDFPPAAVTTMRNYAQVVAAGVSDHRAVVTELHHEHLAVGSRPLQH